MALNLFPKTVRFFELLGRQNAMLVEAADLLSRILEEFGKVDDACKRVNLIEVEADELCREISRQLSLTFITPIDREDIYRLNLSQEDSINLIKGIATRARLYGFTYIRFPARKMARNMREMAGITGEMICCLKDKTDVAAQVKQLKAIKGECEMLLGTGLAESRHARRGGHHEVDPGVRPHRAGRGTPGRPCGRHRGSGAEECLRYRCCSSSSSSSR